MTRSGACGVGNPPGSPGGGSGIPILVPRSMSVLVPILMGLTFLGSALVALPNLAVEVVKRRSPDVVFSVDTQDSIVALTIDDGPSTATPELLDLLERHGARATFFLIGEHVLAEAGIAERIVAGGHEVGHHMMRDEPSVDLPPEVFRERFEATHEILAPLGASAIFRPGSGWYDDAMLAAVGRAGYRTILGSVYPFDAQIPAPGLASWYVLQSVLPGSVIVLHDGPERGPRTAEVLSTVLPELSRRGYRFVTVSELLDAGNGSLPAPAPEAGRSEPTAGGRGSGQR